MDQIAPDFFGIIGWAIGLFIAIGSYRQGKSSAVKSIAEATGVLLDPLLKRIKSLEQEMQVLQEKLEDCLKNSNTE